MHGIFSYVFISLGDMERSSSYSTFIETQQLVLDVDPPGRVVLRRKVSRFLYKKIDLTIVIISEYLINYSILYTIEFACSVF